MPEKEKQEQPFIKEKIKNKPLNKKKLLLKGAETTVFAVLFGVVACFVFYMMQPKMKRWFAEEPQEVFTIPDDTQQEDTRAEAESSAAEDEDTKTDAAGDTAAEDAPPSGQTAADETEAGGQETVQTEEERQTFDLAAYQKMQDELYAVGAEAGRFMVTVTGITDGEGLFDTISEATGQAAGIIIASNRKEFLILTDARAVTDVREIRVAFVNHEVANAEIRQYDGNTRIAVLSVPASEVSDVTKRRIEAAELGNSLTVKPGKIVVALGLMFGSSQNVLTGNITAVSDIATLQDRSHTVFITDIAADGRENGALINTDGEVVGLLFQDASLPQGVLTAVSISELKEVIERLSNGQEIPYFGIIGSTVTDAISEEYDVPKGVYIKEAVMDAPAMEAGLQNGDVIVEMDGQEILTMDDFRRCLMEHSPEDRIKVKADRQNGEKYREYSCTVEVGVLK